MRVLWILVFGSLALSACGREPSTSDVKTPSVMSLAPAVELCDSKSLSINDAWVRAAPAGRPTTAAYFKICNGGEEDRLLSVSFSGAAAVELHHSSVDEDGTAIMTPASSGIKLPAGQVFELAPGGAHVMLMGVADELKEGTTVSMTLKFAKSPAQQVEFEVRPAMSGGAN